jgi:hypothetical protein
MTHARFGVIETLWHQVQLLAQLSNHKTCGSGRSDGAQGARARTSGEGGGGGRPGSRPTHWYLFALPLSPLNPRARQPCPVARSHSRFTPSPVGAKQNFA